MGYSFVSGQKCCEDYNNNHLRIGMVAMIFPLISIISSAYHWWESETLDNAGRSRLQTFPLVIGQMYPQFCYLRLLQNKSKKDKVEWNKEKEFLDDGIALIEGLEAFSQYIMLTCLFLLDPYCFGPNGMDTIHKTLWFAKLISSFCSGKMRSFTTIGFYLSGPTYRSPIEANKMKCKLALNGMISLVEWLSEYLIMYMGIMIALNGDPKPYSKLQSLRLFLISHYLVPVLFAAFQMLLGFGIRNTLKIYLKYPDLIRIQATNGKVFASTDHKYNCYHFASFQMNPELHVGCTFSHKPGTSFSHRHYLSMVNYFLSALSDTIVFVLMLYPHDGIPIAGLNFFWIPMTVGDVIIMVTVPLVLNLVARILITIWWIKVGNAARPLHTIIK